MKSKFVYLWLTCALFVAVSVWGQHPFGASDPVYGLRSRVADDPSFTYTPSPADWRDINMYQIFTDRFASSGENLTYIQNRGWYVGSRSYPDNRNYHHGGDWKGLLNNLDYLEGLGVNAVWMSGVQMNWQGLDTRFTPYHMYHPTDFFKVDPAMGTFQDLKNVIDAMHARGIYVILDVVINHTADLSGLWGNNREDNKWFHPQGNNTHGWWDNNRKHAPPFDDLQYFHNHGRIRNWDSYPEYLIGAFPGTDDLRTSRQDVRDWLDLAFKNLIDATDCDGFRVDAIKHVEEDWIMKWADDMRKHAAFRGKHDFIIFGEYFTYDNETLARYCRQPGYSFNSALFFPMSQTFMGVFVHGDRTARLTDTLNLRNAYGEGTHRLVTFIDNHDVNRIGFEAGSNPGHIEWIMPPALTFLYTATPVPCLFYGTEHAFQQGGHRNGQNAGPDYDDADHQRETMFNKGFQPGPAQGNKLAATNAPLYQHIARLNRARRDHISLRRGSFAERWSTPHGRGAYAFLRTYDEEQALVAFNTADHTETINPEVSKPDGTEFFNTLNPTETVTVSGGRISFSLAGKQSKIFVAGTAAAPLWVRGTHSWPVPGEVTSDTPIYINTEAGPAGDVVSVTLGYSLDNGATWATMPMTMNPDWSSEGGAWYNATLGTQPAGTIIKYYIHVEDAGTGEVYDNNNGQDYTLVVTQGSGSGLWVRNVKNWPVDGAATSVTELWIDAEAGPLGQITAVNVFYGTDGSTWDSMAMTLNVDWGSDGGHWYNANLGTFPSGATVYYYVEATDGEDVAVANNGGLNFVVTIRGAGLVITNPPQNILVSHSVATYTLQGTADGVEGFLRWTNALTGTSGQIAAATPWSLPNVDLGVGANRITVSGDSAGMPSAIAWDSGSMYGGGWTDGSNQGFGFGAWSFSHNQGSGAAGVFIGDPAAAGISGMSENSFGFYANPPGSGANAEVLRSFASPMAVGTTFWFDLGLNWDSNHEDSYRGFSLLAGDTELIYINMANSAVIGINGNPMFSNYGAQAMTLRFDYLASGSIRVRGTGRDGAETYDQTLAVAAGAPTRFKFYFNATDDGTDERQMYVDQLLVGPTDGVEVLSASVTITREETVADCNEDGVPDSWYLEHGMDPCVPGQGSLVGPNGYTYWESFMLNLDPANDNVPAFLMAATSTHRVLFRAPAGSRKYVLQFTPDLKQAWADIRGVDVEQEIETVDEPVGFYRIRYLEGSGGGGVVQPNPEFVTLGATPGNSTFTNPAGLPVTLSVSGSNVVSSTYAVDGGAPSAYVNGQSIMMGAGLDVGQSSTLTLHGETANGTTATATYGYTRIAGGGQALTHVGGTHHWVSDENQVFINSAGYPEGTSVEAWILYCVDPPCEGNWPLVEMNRIPDWENGDWWNMDLGIQPDGTVIQFAIMMKDAFDNEVWDNNNGQDYTVVIGGGGVVEPGGNLPYSTNPTFGKRGTMTINGNPAGWTDEHLIALDMANDDPRSLGDNWTMHEAPLDVTHLWAAWDDNNLYLAWQFVDVTDVIDPANAGGAGSGKISNNDGILQWIVIDTIPGQGATTDVWGKKNSWVGPNKPNYQIYLAGSLWQGYISRAVGGTFALDDGGVNYNTIAAAGITVAKGHTFGGSSLWGVQDADHRWNSDAPTHNFLAMGHDTSRDSFYEMSIPLSYLGITAAQIEANGIGIMLGAGSESSMDSIPHDETTLATHGVTSWNSSLEWSDDDLFTSPFARVGK